MSSINRHVVLALAACVLLIGCSSGTSSRRASLISDSGAPPSRYQAARNMPGDDGVGYYGNSRSRAETRALDAAADAPYPLSPPVPVGPSQSDTAPLRRFAAMPRYMPHAPHVRQYERSCLDSGIVQTTAYVRPRASIGGGQCYIDRPFQMLAAAGGRVRFDPPATLRCQMVPSIEAWTAAILRPAARRILGSDVVRLHIAGSYGCRTRNHQFGARLSEHGKANALDISKFYLADGRVITVEHGWHGSEAERSFLRYIHRGACEHFSTVLGPNADRHHRNHLHFDLASHGPGGTYRVCK